MPEQPNVIALVSHDTGRHISPYGVETVDTPNFERLAGESVRFANAFSAAPQCSPARAALFSGRYPHAVGVMGNVGREHGWRFPDAQRHAGRIFADTGYQSWLLGAQHETWMPETLGFDRVDMGFPIADAADHLAACLEQRRPDQPFYCQIGCPETHRPWGREGTPPDDSRGVWTPPYLADGPLTRADLAQLQGCVKQLDAGLGRLLDLLDERGLADNTILVVTTDHGIAVPRAKCTLFDSGIGVFLFMRWPGGGWRAGTVEPQLVSHVDLMPTLLDACAREPAAGMQGQSFLPLLRGEPGAPRDTVFAEKTFFQFYDPMRCVRTTRHKYIRNFELCRIMEIGLDCADSGSAREVWDRYLGGHPAEELYDLEADPGETVNLAGRPDCEELRQSLAAELARWMTDTNDPLLRGPVHSPYHQRQVDELLRLIGP